MPLTDEERARLDAWVGGHAGEEHRTGKPCLHRKGSKMNHEGLHQACGDVDEMRKLAAKA